MSALESLRKGLDSTSTRVLIGVVAGVFILWGVGGGSDSRTAIVATVNGETITTTEVTRVFQNAVRQMGGSLSDSEQQQVYADVIDQLVTQSVLLQEAERLGLAVTPEEVARQLKKQEAFQGEDGKFDSKVYERTLKQAGLTAARYEQQLHDAMLIEKLQDLVIRGVDVTEAEVRSTWQAQATEVDVTFVRVPDTAFLADIPVSDAERDTFVQQNGDRLKQRYDTVFERQYNLPRRYTLSTILLRTDIEGVDKEAVRARAEQVHAQAVAGADFATLARTWSEDLSASTGGSLGTVAQSQLDPVLAQAADAVGAGKVSAVTETGRGFQILQVAAIDEARVVAFEEARVELATQMLREEKVGDVARAWAAELLGAWRAGGPDAQAKLDARGLRFESTGAFPLAAPSIPRLGEVPEVRAALTATPVGEWVPVPVKTPDGFVVAQITARTEPDAARYEQEKALVRARLRFEKQQAFAEAWTQALVAKARVERTPAPTDS